MGVVRLYDKPALYIVFGQCHGGADDEALRWRAEKAILAPVIISISALSATSSHHKSHSPKAYTCKNNRVGGNNHFRRPDLSYAPLSLLRLGRATLILAAFQQGVTYRHAEQRRGKNADLGLHVAGGVAKGERGNLSPK